MRLDKGEMRVGVITADVKLGDNWCDASKVGRAFFIDTVWCTCVCMFVVDAGTVDREGGREEGAGRECMERAMMRTYAHMHTLSQTQFFGVLRDGEKEVAAGSKLKVCVYRARER